MSQLKEVAPNFREAMCCANCKHYKLDYDGEGQCLKFITEDNKSEAGWYDVCDWHDFKERYRG